MMFKNFDLLITTLATHQVSGWLRLRMPGSGSHFGTKQTLPMQDLIKRLSNDGSMASSSAPAQAPATAAAAAAAASPAPAT